MKPAALTLAVLAVIGLATSTGVAGPPSAAHVTTTLVAHHGHPGYHYGWHRPLVVRPPVLGHPTIVYPRPGHHPVVHPRARLVYDYYDPYYRPYGGFSYYGRGFGFSIGW